MSSDCGCSQNQTPTKSLEALLSAEKSSQPVTGWGLFVVPDPEAGPLKVKAIYIDNIDYDECCDRGHNCIAFKWVHGSLMTFTEAKKNSVGVLQRCINGGHCRVDLDCSWNCFCHRGRCYQF